MSMKLKKILRIVFKIVLLLVGLSVIGYVGYLTYMSFSSKPRDVRVSNITDSSFTVSWVTDSPRRGIVYYKEKEGFLPGPLAWIGSGKAVDDRDLATAQNGCVEEFNKKAGEEVGEDFVVSVENFDCEDVDVDNYGEYFTHHVTLKNLNEQKKYHFRVGDTFWYWDGQEESASTFAQLEEVKEPIPIFGRIVDTGGVYTDDSVIYATFKNGREDKESILYSSVTNERGGWYLDGSYIRTDSGELVGMESGQDLFRANAQYMNYSLSDTYEWVFGYFGGNYPDMVIDSAGKGLEVGNPTSELIKVLGVEDTSQSGDVLGGGCLCTVTEKEAKEIGWGRAYRKCASQGYSGVVNEEVLACFGHAGSATAIAGNLSAVTGSGGAITANEVKDADNKAYINNGTVTAGASPSVASSGDTDSSADDGNPGSEYSSGYSISVNKFTGLATIGAITVDMNGYIDNLESYCGGATGSTCNVCIGKGTVLDGCNVVLNPAEINFLDFVSYLASQVQTEINNPNPNSSDLSQYEEHLSMLEPLAEEYLSNTSKGKTFTYKGETYSLKADSQGDLYFTIEGENYSVEQIIESCDSDAQLSCLELELQSLKDIKTFRENVQKVKDLALLSSEELREKLSESHGYEEGICILSEGCKCAAEGERVEEGQSYTECGPGSAEGVLALAVDGQSKCGLEECSCNYTYGDETSDNDYTSIVHEGETCPPIMERTDAGNTTCSGCVILNPLAEGVVLDTIEYAGGVRCLEDQCACGGGKISFGYVCTADMYRSISNGKKTKIRQFNSVCNDPDGCFCVGTAAITLRWSNERKLRKTNLPMGQYCFAGIEPKTYKQLSKTNEKGIVEFDEYCEHPNGCFCAGQSEVLETELCVNDEAELIPNSSILDGEGSLRTLWSLLDALMKSTLTINQAFANSGNDYTYFLPEYGFYDMEVEGLIELENVPALEAGEQRLFYVETNGIDGLQMPKDPENPQPGEDILLRSNALKIRYKSTASSQALELQKGINIVSFDYIPKINKEGPTKASDLLRYLQEKNNVVGFMSYFEGGRWKGVILHKGELSGTDFILLPGRGYLIRALTDVSTKIPVFKLKDSIPLPLSSGWNLIGLHGYRKAYTAGSLIDSINLIDGLNADNVSWWPVSKGRYEGLQVTDGTEYGLDFPISPSNGYFVRINDFKPKNQECRSIIWHDRGELHGTCGHSRSIF